MWALFLSATIFSVFVVATSVFNSFSSASAQDDLLVRNEAERVANFKLAADVYLASNPGASGSVLWSAIKTAPLQPSGIAGAAIPPSWKAVYDGNGRYVLCVDIRTGSAHRIESVMNLWNNVSVYSHGGRFVLTNSQANAATEAAKC